MENEDILHYGWNINQAIENAIEKGFTVIRSNDSTILLDMDNGRSSDQFKYICPKIWDKFNLCIIDSWKSKNLNDHIIFSCNKMSFPERIAIAACLGSDPIREALAISMYHDGIVEPSVLFRPKEIEFSPVAQR